MRLPWTALSEYQAIMRDHSEKGCGRRGTHAKFDLLVQLGLRVVVRVVLYFHCLLMLGDKTSSVIRFELA